MVSVFQDYNLLDTLTLAENVALPLLLDKRDPTLRVRQTLALLGVDALADRFPYQASGGQQQRAAGHPRCAGCQLCRSRHLHHRRDSFYGLCVPSTTFGLPSS